MQQNNNKLIYLYNTHPSFDCTMLQFAKINSNYCFQMLQVYPDCVSLWLILSRARKARQFLEFAETLKVRNCNFKKKIERCESKISFLIVLLFLSNHFNNSIWLRQLRMICGKQGRSSALKQTTVLWCPVRAFGPIFESTGTNLKRSHSHNSHNKSSRRSPCRVKISW